MQNKNRASEVDSNRAGWLETARLIIRPLEENDYLFMYRLLTSGPWLRFIGDRNIHTEDDAKKYTERIMNSPDYQCHVFMLKTSQEKLGIVTFINRKEQQAPDIGYAMLPEFGRQGYAFEATKKYFDDLQKRKVSEKIIAITVAENTLSIRLLKKLGMVLEKKYSEDGKDLLLFRSVS